MNIRKVIENHQAMKKVDAVKSLTLRVRAEAVRLRLARLVYREERVSAELAGLSFLAVGAPGGVKVRARFCDLLERQQTLAAGIVLHRLALGKVCAR